MKIARTFTIDYHLYQELRKKPNQSRIVERSIKRYLADEIGFDMSEVTTLRLLHVLYYRDDCPKEIKALIPLFTHTTA